MAVDKRKLTKEEYDALCAGSEQAWEDFFHQHKKFLWSLIRKKIPGFCDADVNIVRSDAMLGIVKSVRKWGVMDNYQGYLVRICVYKALDLLKRRKKENYIKEDEQPGVIPLELIEGEVYDPTDVPLGFLWDDEHREKAERCFKKFRKQYSACYEILQLRYGDDEKMKYWQIAEKMGIGIEQVGARIHRCIEHLERHWNEENE